MADNRFRHTKKNMIYPPKVYMKWSLVAKIKYGL